MKKIKILHFKKLQVPKSDATMWAKVEKAFEVVHTRIKDALSGLKWRFNISLDIWTTKNMAKSYLGVYVHYISSKHRLETLFLGVSHMIQRHTGKYIKQLYEEVLTSYGIQEEKVFRMVSDSAKNVVCAFKHDIISKLVQNNKRK